MAVVFQQIMSFSLYLLQFIVFAFLYCVHCLFMLSVFVDYLWCLVMLFDFLLVSSFVSWPVRLFDSV